MTQMKYISNMTSLLAAITLLICVLAMIYLILRRLRIQNFGLSLSFLGQKVNLDLEENPMLNPKVSKAYQAHRVKMSKLGHKETPGQQALKAYKALKAAREKKGNPELKVSRDLLDLLEAMEKMEKMEQQVNKELKDGK